MTLKKEGLLSTDDQEIRARILNSLKRSAVIEFPPTFGSLSPPGWSVWKGLSSCSPKKQ
ncbi:MAG: hypothetical protein MPW14_18620 [Candidatus Manganitrophus sp.]|nr:MAG: hypothetical protein MPW14_18620 [Candidatus Manganitrophus sp.]